MEYVLSFLNSDNVHEPGTPTTDLFIYCHKQTIYYFLISLCFIICLGFFHVYVNFHQNSPLRKRDICVVSIISKQPSYRIKLLLESHLKKKIHLVVFFLYLTKSTPNSEFRTCKCWFTLSKSGFFIINLLSFPIICNKNTASLLLLIYVFVLFWDS